MLDKVALDVETVAFQPIFDRRRRVIPYARTLAAKHEFHGVHVPRRWNDDPFAVSFYGETLGWSIVIETVTHRNSTHWPEMNAFGTQ